MSQRALIGRFPHVDAQTPPGLVWGTTDENEGLVKTSEQKPTNSY
ncbi:hypothetical protein [Fischerella thermalis]|nr:hypothetical protein [Fischerella thermalis]